VGTLQPDGSGSINSGLFVTRTISDLLYGYVDPLFLAVPASAVPAGVKLEYEGLRGYNPSSIAELQAAFANGTKEATDYTYIVDSGKTELADISKWYSWSNFSVLKPGDSYYPGWGINGTLGADLDLRGMHSITQQSPRTSAMPNIINSAGIFTPHVEPNFGPTSIELFLDTAYRDFVLECESVVNGEDPECGGWHDVKGIVTKRFMPPVSLGNFSVNGVVTNDSSCAGQVSANYVSKSPLPTGLSASTCDYGLRFQWVFDLSTAKKAPATLSLPYLGWTEDTVRNAVSILKNGSEVIFDPVTDGTFLDLEPMTGKVFNGEERLQFNFMIEKTMLNSNRYASIFGATTDNGDRFVWPYAILDRQTTLTDDQASKFKSAVYGAYVMAFIVVVVGSVVGLLMICCACATAGKDGKGAKSSPFTEMSASANL